MQFLKRLIKRSNQFNYYNSIDELPIKIWFNIHKTGNYKLLLKSKKKVSIEENIKLNEIWEIIYNEYIKTFGLSEDYIDYLELKRELALMKCEIILDKSKKHLKTMINIGEEKLKDNSIKSKDDAILSKTIAKISKIYGFHLKQNELTVSEYYSYIENITDGNK